MRRSITALVTACAFLLATSAAASAEPPAGGRDYDDDTVIVKYRPGVSPAEQRPLLQRTGAERTVEEIGALDAEVVSVERDPAEVASRLDENRKVAYAEPNFVMSTQARPDDPHFSAQWALHNVGQPGGRRGADVNAPTGWSRFGLGGFPGGGGVRVGIVDTGIDRGHPDLAGRTVACREFVVPFLENGGCADDTDHGTHVAGILGAIADNGVGIAGVAFNSPLVICRALGGPLEEGRVSDVAKCISWADTKRSKVISMSFAGGRSETLRRALAKAWDAGSRRGAVLVAAAGNNGGRQAAFPAAYPQVISVSATNQRDARAWFSNAHDTVEVAAPGQGILSARRGGGYTRMSGTSMAVPHVSGIAAQLRTDHPRWRAGRVRAVIRRSADDLGPRGRDASFGYGRVDMANAAGR
jgi:thermitase